MVDTVRVRALTDDSENYYVEMTNVSDGTGETDVLKIDAAAIAVVALRLQSIRFMTVGMGVILKWDATVKERMLELPPNVAGSIIYPDKGEPDDPRAAGFTGDVYLSTVGAALNDSYHLILGFAKETV